MTEGTFPLASEPGPGRRSPSPRCAPSGRCRWRPAGPGRPRRPRIPPGPGRRCPTGLLPAKYPDLDPKSGPRLGEFGPDIRSQNAQALAWPQAAGEERRVVITMTRPSTVSASGMGHHQCSQNAIRPCVLSRPVQNMPRTRNRPPAISPARRVTERMPGYYARSTGAGQRLRHRADGSGIHHVERSTPTGASIFQELVPRIATSGRTRPANRIRGRHRNWPSLSTGTSTALVMDAADVITKYADCAHKWTICVAGR